MQTTIKGGQIQSLPNSKHDQALDATNYPTGRSMKEAKRGCEHNGYKPCWEGCPHADCVLPDWKICS
jgi:hypothetical protein